MSKKKGGARTRREKKLSPVTEGWRKKIGATVRELRERHGWKQEALAMEAHVSRKTITDLENGNRSSGVDALIKSVIALSADPWTLFGGNPATRPRRRIDHQVRHDELDRVLATGRKEVFEMIDLFLSGLPKAKSE